MKISIFIDGNNFYFTLKRIYGDKNLNNFNFEKFCNFLINGNKLIDIFYYNAELDKDNDYEKYLSQKKFFNKIKKIHGFNLILCNLVKRRVGNRFMYTLKEDDIHLAVDLVLGACDDSYDEGILVSGDGDFVPAVLAARKKEKKIGNVYYKRGSSLKLRKSCNSIIKLNKAILDGFFDED